MTEHYAYALKESLLRDMDAIDAAFFADDHATSDEAGNGPIEGK